MATSHPDKHRQLLALLQQVITVASALAQPLPATRPGNATKSRHPGIYPHTSKYNPWRAYVWDAASKRSIYLGAFTSIPKAKAAQQAYRTGQPVASGTRALLLRRVA